MERTTTTGQTKDIIYLFKLSVLLLLLPLVFIFERCKNLSYIRDIFKEKTAPVA
jgi:hypothetical protein